MREVGAVIAAVSLSAAATAQDIVFPADQFGRSTLYNAQSTENFEAVLLGNPRFEPLADYAPDDALRRLSRPIGRLDILKDGGVSVCTASVIGPDLILTNHHCVPGRSGGPVRELSLLMGYYSDIDHRGEKRYAVRTTPVEASAELDFAVLRVAGRPGDAWGTARLEPRDPSAGGSLMIVHHPAGKPKHVSRGGCRAATPHATSGDQIFHRCDTLPGSSGSPVFLADMSGAVVGLHHAGAPANRLGSDSYNYAKRVALIVEASPTLRELSDVDARREPETPAPSAREVERGYWDACRVSPSIAACEAYLARYPAGAFAELAATIIDGLREEEEWVSVSEMLRFRGGYNTLLVKPSTRG